MLSCLNYNRILLKIWLIDCILSTVRYISPMRINTIGLYTLYRREVWRFMKVWNQTITAPMITTLLFLAILTLALGGGEREVHGINFVTFITPGLIMMAVVQNAFANASSSLMIQKFQGVIIDLLMPPLHPLEITLGMVGGAMTRGVVVCLSVSIAMYIFVPYTVHHWDLAIAFVLLSSLMLALLGLVTGIWAQSFDQMSAITNYVITPFSFLSGTFYSIEQLPGFWHTVSLYNPFFYMIDGFRYALTDVHDGSIAIGLAVLTTTNILLASFAYYLLKTGYRLKT